MFKHNQADENGGAVYNRQGIISFYYVTLDLNSADLNGGGIYALDDLFVSSSTLMDNKALGNGGGIFNNSSASPYIVNCTVYGNSADKGGGLYSLTALIIANSAFVANQAATSGGAICGDTVNRIKNSIVADSLGSANCSAPDGSGYPLNDGNNIDSGSSCGFVSSFGSMSNTDPQLGQLKNNGGPTKTMFPQPESPAINGITYSSPNGCPNADQRGFMRPYGSGYDIGPVEAYYGLFLPQVSK